MKYILEPLNEGQDMNCRVLIKGSKAVALARAETLAQALQTQLLGCSITVRVSRDIPNLNYHTSEKESAEIIVTPDGKRVNL
jgi:hypothetical protein